MHAMHTPSASAGQGGGRPHRRATGREGRGGGGRRAHSVGGGGGGGWLTKEVLVVLVDDQLQAQVPVLRSGIVVIAVVKPVPSTGKKASRAVRRPGGAAPARNASRGPSLSGWMV